MSPSGFVRFVWQLRLIAAILALTGQVGLTGASLNLARDESSAVSHTEQSGIDLHHGHNEANCVACIALSFHATVSSAAPPLARLDAGGGSLASRSIGRIAGPELLSNSCRAPPRDA